LKESCGTYNTIKNLNKELQTKLAKQDKEIKRIQNIAMQLGIHHNEIVEKLEKLLITARKLVLHNTTRYNAEAVKFLKDTKDLK
jgi:benzoyl-CoA reductase/2-hydroxyglutaryl-CoA dehydratase subunit BcrC/BadD/HgdB